MIPSEIIKVKDYEDIPPFHDWFLQQLGDLHRYTMYRINMTSSPHPRCDLERNNWVEQHRPEDIVQLEKAIYLLLKRAFQDFTSTQHIFLQQRVEHSLCDSRTWFSLLDKFKQQLDEDKNRREQRMMRQETQEPEDCEPDNTWTGHAA